MALLYVDYKPDNGLVRGMGGLMMGNGTAKVAMAIAQKYAKYLTASALIAEADARGEELAPGRIIEAFSRANGKATPSVAVINDGGHINPRRTARYEVTGAYEGKDPASGFPKSSPVTIEFGSHYNEGTKGDRPDFRVMLNALRSQSVVTRGMNLAKDAT